MTNIEWTDVSWNPVVGCSKVSTGCRGCYAEAVHKARLSGKHGYPEFRPWSAVNAEHNVTMMPHKIDDPLSWRKPRMVFVNSMSDLFHELLPWRYVAEVFAVMSLAEQHTFQVLTKRPQIMAGLLTWSQFWLHVNAGRMRRGYDVLPGGITSCWPTGNKTLSNVWLGTSIENRKWVGRADYLRKTPAAVRFISAEPLLGPLVMPSLRDGVPRGAGRRIWPDGYTGPQLSLDGIDWVIVGGESGARARPMDPEWARDLRDACQNQIPPDSSCNCFVPTLEGVGNHSPGCSVFRWRGTAFFFKQHGGRTPKAGGRELDGRTWDEMPAPPQAALGSA